MKHIYFSEIKRMQVMLLILSAFTAFSTQTGETVIKKRKKAPDFLNLLKTEVDISCELALFPKTNPPPKEANAQLRKVAGECAYCHQRYFAYDRMSPNRVKYLYSQYPKARLETDWVKGHKV